MIDVALVSPPVFKACEPLLGLATLKAWLEGHGVTCACIDANAEAQDFVLQTERIVAAEAALRMHGRGPRERRLAKAASTLRDHVRELARLLRCKEGYGDWDRYRTAATSLNRAMAVAGAAHDAGEGSPIAASLTDYLDARYCDMDSASVAEATEHPEHNLFYAYYDGILVPRIRELRPGIVGLSLVYRSQLLCGAVLAGMIRRALPGTHVVLGGELLSTFAPFLGETELPRLTDSILPYEGEMGLLELSRVLSARSAAADEPDLGAVPNLGWLDGSGRWRQNPARAVSALADLPAPDYSFAPWDLYFAPVRTAPLSTARGCYHGRCTFCPETIGRAAGLRLASAERVCADMDVLHERYGVSCLHVVDSSIPPRTVAAVAEHVAAGRRPYTWYGFSRLEPRLAAIRHLRAGGCRMLELGLETGSQRLLDAMGKRQDVRRMSGILRSLRDGRVLVHGFLMFGTPLEEEADAEQTLGFVAEHADCVQFLNCSLMNLPRGSPMWLRPAGHGVLRVVPFEIEGRRLDLALYDNFEARGWGRMGARRFLHRRFLRDPRIRLSHVRTPPHFDSNHSVFFHPLVFG